jgi:hypothetical protein
MGPTLRNIVLGLLPEATINKEIAGDISITESL